MSGTLVRRLALYMHCVHSTHFIYYQFTELQKHTPIPYVTHTHHPTHTHAHTHTHTNPTYTHAHTHTHTHTNPTYTHQFPVQEIIYSTSVTVSINPQDQLLPTVCIERSSNIHLHYCKPTVFGSVFTVDCSDVSVHFQPPHKEEYQLELPSDPVGQYVSELKKTEMIISKVIRGGLVMIT